MDGVNGLEPRTVYLAPVSIADAEKRAADLGVTPGQFLRMVLTGKQPPLKA